MENSFGDDEYVYHYTSAEGVMGILKSQCLYATHANFLNDYKEVVEGIELIKSSTQNIKDLCSESMEKYLAAKNDIKCELTAGGILSEIQEDKIAGILSKSLEGALKNNLKTDVYITSFTKKRDSLSHWLTYGKSNVAYCIKFKFEHLQNTDLAKRKKLISCLREVNYTGQVGDSILPSLDYLTEKSVEIFQSRESSSWNMELGRLFGHFIVDLQVFSAMLKNSKFCSEEEVRFITIKPLGIKVNEVECDDFFEFSQLDELECPSGKESTLEFRSSRSGIITPFFSVPFNVKAIEEIIIGPGAHFEDAQKGLKYYIDSLGLGVEVTESDCPYRNI
jgi:hypothetical protein